MDIEKTFEEEFHCLLEIEKNKKVFVVHDKYGNYATSPYSYQEAKTFLEGRIKNNQCLYN